MRISQAKFSFLTMRSPSADPLLMAHERAVSLSAVQRAALHIQDAFDGTEHVHPREGRALRRLWLVHLALIVPCRLALAGLLLLSFLEQPPWVLEARRHVPNADIETHYPNFGLPMLPVATSLAVEGALLLMLVLDAACMVIAQGVPAVLNGRLPVRVYLCALALAIVDVVVAAAGEARWAMADGSVWPWKSMRLAWHLRLTMLVLRSDDLLSAFDLVRRSIPRFGGVFFVLVLYVLTYGWAAVLLFRRAEEGVSDFDTLAEAIWTLLITLTTANFPDVMMPFYTRSRLVVLFFGPYLLLGHIFLLNLVLAVVVHAYSENRAALATGATDCH